jgi:hypothetical protein
MKIYIILYINIFINMHNPLPAGFMFFAQYLKITNFVNVCFF